MGRNGRKRWNARSVPTITDGLACTRVCCRSCTVANTALTLSMIWPNAEVALEREVEGDLFLADIGQGIPFRAGAFDGAIS